MRIRHAEPEDARAVAEIHVVIRMQPRGMPKSGPCMHRLLSGLQVWGVSCGGRLKPPCVNKLIAVVACGFWHKTPGRCVFTKRQGLSGMRFLQEPWSWAA